MMKKVLKIFSSVLIVCLLVACDKFNFINKQAINENTNESKNESSEVVIEGNYNELPVATSSQFTLSKYELPNLNDNIYGFNVKSIYDFDTWNAKIVNMEHEKTGMRVLLISNADEDKSFVVGVHTKAEDDRGIPHIFEHATIDSSEGYPISDGFFSMNGKLYTTFLNACTGDEVTFYPVSSLSDEQLFAVYKYYIEGLFNPMILKDSRIFDKEGARYMLYNKEDDLKMSGAAYNEMSAQFANESYQLSCLGAKAIFENGHLGNNSGGDYRQIIDITHQDLIDFHDKYYHPSNMCMYLYGDIDYEKYLKLINENYLKNYDKKEFDFGINDYIKNETLKEVNFDLPVASDFNTENNTIFEYDLRLEGVSSYEIGVLDIVAAHFSMSDGKLYKLLKEKLPNASLNVSYSYLQSVPVFNFMFRKVDSKDKNVIKEILNESIKDLIENGISQELIDMRINDIAMGKELEKDEHGFALKDDIYPIMQMTFRDKTEDYYSYFLYRKGREEIGKRYNDGTLNRLIEKYFENRNDGVFIEYTPTPGLLEELVKEDADKVVNKKNTMSNEEIDALIEKNKDYDIWLKNAHDNFDISKFSVASVSSLDVYNPKVYAYEENKEGIRFIKSLVDDFMFNQVTLCFDAKNIPYEDLHKLSLLSSLFNDIPTDKRKGEDLLSAIYKKVYDYNTGLLNIKEAKSQNYNPYFCVDIKLLDKNLDDVFNLLKERLFEIRFDDISVIKNELPAIQYNLQRSFVRNADSYADKYFECVKNTSLRYDDYVFNAAYLKFINEVLAMNDDELKALLNDMSNIWQKLLNKRNMICEIVSNPDTSTKIKNLVIDLSNDLTDNKYDICDYDVYFDNYKEKAGLIYDGVANYNYMGIFNPENDINITGKHLVVAAILNDILYDEYRAKRGAYGARVYTNRNRTFLNSYDDPNVKESIDVARTIPALYDNLNLTEEQLENYKLNAYSRISYPKTKSGLASIAISQIVLKDDENDASRYARYMQEIKDMTLEDVKEMSSYVHMIFESPVYTSVGSENKITEAKDYFDIIKKIDSCE